MKLFLSTSFIFILSIKCLAQQPISIKGRVLEANSNEPLPFASVLLSQARQNNDSLKIGRNTDEKGEFLIQNLTQGKTKIIISFVGYQKYEGIIELNSNLDLGKILLQSETNLLKEVNVKAQKSTAKLDLDKRVFSVSENITTIGGTAENLLRNIPSLSIDANGSAILRNSTATIYVNGKPTQLNLTQIPANQIESVEVISNPSAKYEASATGGIVNLILKKNKMNGHNGILSIGIGNNKRFDGMVNVELNRGKWGFSGIYNANATQNPLDNYANRIYYNSSGQITGFYNQNTAIKLNNNFQNIRLSIDYNPNKKNTISLAGTLITGQYNSITNQTYQNTDSNKSLTSYGNRNTTPQNQLLNQGIEFDWKHTYARKGKSLNFLTAFNHNDVSNAANWLTSSLTGDGKNQTGSPEKDKISGNTVGNQFITQLDFVQPINDSTKWEVGVRSLSYIRDQKYFFNQFQETSNTYILLPEYSQNAKITETVNAVYALYSTKLRNNFELQAGLRVEQSSLSGQSRFEPPINFGYQYPSKIGKNWIKAFFPSFALTKRIDSKTDIGINVSRKIGRPGWRQVFIGIQSNDKQNITIGNPALQPEFVNTAELNLNKSLGKNTWFSSLYYIYEDNTIKPYVSPSLKDPSILVTTFTNVKVDIQGGWENTATFYLGKNLSILANANVFNFTLQTDSTSKSLWTARTKLNLSYKFGSNWTLQLNSNYDFKAPSLQGYRAPVRGIDFAFRKSFWKNKGSLAFTINDIFNSRKQISIYEQALTYQTSMSRREVRFYKLTLQLPLNRNVSVNTKKKSINTRPDVDFSN